MERLTVKRRDGRWAIANNDGANPTEQMLKIPKVIDRLAEYEDTGLTPEEIRDMTEKANTMLLTWFEAKYGMPVGELAGWLEAKQEGRLVVLSRKYRGRDGERALRKAEITVSVTNNGVNRYIVDAVAEKLVREEAEAALKGASE